MPASMTRTPTSERRSGVHPVSRRSSQAAGRALDAATPKQNEVFLKVVEKQSTFRAEAQPTTWLYQMTTNHCLNRLRDRRRRAEKLALNAELPWLLPSGATDAETTLFL